MKNKIVICALFLFVLSSCNWNKPKPGEYILEVNGTIHDPTYGDHSFNGEYPFQITQSTIHQISMTGTCPYYSNTSCTLNKKGKKVNGTLKYKCGGQGAASEETFRLNGKIISGNHHNIITGTLTGDLEYQSSINPGYYQNYYEGTFKIRPK